MTGSLNHIRRLIAVIGDEQDDEVILPWARVLATDLHLPLTLLSASQPEQAAAAAAALAIVSSDGRLSRLTVDTRLEPGSLEAVLPAVTASQPGTLTLLPQPRGGQQAETVRDWPILGLLTAMTSSFVVIPAGAKAPSHVHSVVVGNDGSDLAGQVIDVARTIGHSLGVDVIEVQAIEPRDIAGGMAAIQPVVTPRLIRATGRASRVLLRAARARDAALIVVGSHGLGRSSTALAGSTVEWLLIHSDRPILVVPHG